MTTRVRAFSRIHVGLVDLAGATARAYGGLGFFVREPNVVVEVEQTSEPGVSAPEMAERDTDDLRAAVDRWVEETDEPVRVTVREIPPQHVGFGTKTATTLSLLLGASHCCGVELSDSELQNLSGRGGVSGVGINGFFSGGLIVDAGQPSSVVPPFEPSSFSTPTEIPPVVSRSTVPSEWRVSLFLPETSGYSGEQERDFFRDNTPVPTSEVMKTLSAVYHGVVPAVENRDIQQLSSALVDIHQTGFKQREVANQSERVRALLTELQSREDVAAGLSSMGPLVYAIHRQSADPIPPTLNQDAVLGQHPPSNQPAHIQD